MRRVGIIGAGASGLTAIKCLRDEGVEEIVCYEMGPDVGGLWRFSETEGHSSVYRSTVINTSKEMMCYADYPIAASEATFLHNSRVCGYLRSYGERFGLLKYIRFSTKVTNVEKIEDGRWKVTSKPAEGKEQSDVFDYVLVASGHHSFPNTATFPGQETFQGKIIHSHSYKSPTEPIDCVNKDVVIVGIGNSAVDLSVELSRASKAVYQSTRRGSWLVSRYPLFGIPLDHFNARIFNFLPIYLMSKLFEVITLFSLGNLSNFNLKPKHHFMSQHPTINSELLGRIGTGSLIIKPNIKEIKKNSVVFEDGSEVHAGIIIMATGYKIHFPFLDPSIIDPKDNKMGLYKFIFHPEHDGLGFIGYFQPIGAIMPISEMQCRWIARVVTEKTALPSRMEMEKDIRKKQKEMATRYVDSPRHTIQVDYLPYMDELADQIGVRPTFFKCLRLSWRLAFIYLFKFNTPVMYRLFGPGKWDNALPTILRMHRLVFSFAQLPKALAQAEHGKLED